MVVDFPHEGVEGFPPGLPLLGETDPHHGVLGQQFPQDALLVVLLQPRGEDLLGPAADVQVGQVGHLDEILDGLYVLQFVLRQREVWRGLLVLEVEDEVPQLEAPVLQLAFRPGQDGVVQLPDSRLVQSTSEIEMLLTSALSCHKDTALLGN